MEPASNAGSAAESATDWGSATSMSSTSRIRSVSHAARNASSSAVIAAAPRRRLRRAGAEEAVWVIWFLVMRLWRWRAASETDTESGREEPQGRLCQEIGRGEARARRGVHLG